MEHEPENTPAELVMEKLVYGGDALARWEGKVVLAPFLLPGERARVAIAEGKQGLWRGKPVEILEPAEGRVEPGCPHFAACGGCHYQHASYALELEWKRRILTETLERAKLAPPERVRVISGPEWGYRNRVQLHLDRARIGYPHPGTRRLRAIESCPVASPRLNEAIAALRGMLHEPRFPRFLETVELFSNETDVQVNVLASGRRPARWFFDWMAERVPGYVDGPLDYPAAGVSYRVSHQAFFQVNRFLVAPLVEAALEGAEGESALDLYAGVGLFTLPLARRFRRVAAVESGGAAVRDLIENTRRAGVDAGAFTLTAEAFLEGLDTAPDFVLADPPRSGLGKRVVKRLLAMRPRRLTVVSCDPSTLARDLAALTAGGYRLDSLDMADLFPRTYHIESVARLSLLPSSAG